MSSSSGVKTDAFRNYGIGQGLSNQLTANAQNVYAGLEPQLQAMAAHPQGLNPTQKAAMNTAAQQSAGGSTAAAQGEGRLYSARTHNAGGAKAAIGSGIRGAGENLSNAAVGTELANAQLQNKQQQAGLSGLEGLNQTELSGGLNALGESNRALDVANNAKDSFWTWYLKNQIQAADKMATAGTAG
jgi:hypothetical protein